MGLEFNLSITSFIPRERDGPGFPSDVGLFTRVLFHPSCWFLFFRLMYIP